MSKALPAPDGPGQIRSGKLAGKSMWAAIWILAIPVLLQQTMHAVVGLVDKIIAGDLRPEIVVAALDGLGIGSYVGWFVGIAMTGLGIGGQALIARALGAGAVAEGERALGQAMALSAGWGVIVGLCMWAGAPALARMCGLDDDAAAYCVQYIRCIAAGVPPYGVMLVGSMCLYGGGETARPSAIAIVVGLLNMPLSWLLSGAVLDVGGLELGSPLPIRMDVVGIALGTSLSWLVGALLTIAVLLRGVKDLRLRFGEMRLDTAMVWRLVRVGVPSFMEGISLWAVNLLVLVIIGVIARTTDAGPGLQGAHIIAVQWESFSFMPGFAIGIAAGTLAGQYLGAGSPPLARRAIMTCTGLAMVVMVSLGLVFIFGGGLLTRLVSSEQVHLEHAPNLLLICGVTQVFFAITMVVRQGMRGVGDTRWTFAITTFSSYAVRLPAAWVLGVTLGLGLEGVWLGLCGELVIRAALFGARFLHGGWARIEV